MKFQAAESLPPEHPILNLEHEIISYGEKTSSVFPPVAIHHLSDKTSDAEKAQQDPHFS